MSDEEELEDILPGNGELPARAAIRIHKLTSRVKALKLELEQKATRIVEMQTEHTATLAERDEQIGTLTPFQERVTELEARTAELETERIIFGAGLTSDQGVDAARMFWDRIPEADRPEGGMAAWLGEENREHLPKSVSVHFGDDTTTTTTTHRPDAGVRTETRAQRATQGHTGNWADVREAELAELGITPVDIGALTGKSA